MCGGQDRGDRVLVLTDMLPYVAGPFECRTVVAEVLQGLESEKVRQPATAHACLLRGAKTP